VSWLRSDNYFVIEINQESFLEMIERLFAVQGLQLNRVNQRRLPLIGREMRSEKNWWPVSALNEISR
jgi:hypothetical protein